MFLSKYNKNDINISYSRQNFLQVLQQSSRHLNIILDLGTKNVFESSVWKLFWYLWTILTSGETLIHKVYILASRIFMIALSLDNASSWCE